METCCYDCKHSCCESTFFIDSYDGHCFPEQNETLCRLTLMCCLEEDEPHGCQDYVAATCEEGTENRENIDKFYSDRDKAYKLLDEAAACYEHENQPKDENDFDAICAARPFNWDGTMGDKFAEYFKKYVNDRDPDLWFRHTDKGYGEY